MTTLMSLAKTCKTAFALLYRSVAKFTWDKGPWQISHIMSSFFALESPLNTSMHDLWQPLNVQTATGQTIALDIGYASFEANGKKFDGEDEWSVVLVACGLWVNLREKVIPSLMMSESAIKGLDQVLRSDMSFRADLAAVSAKDPPANMSAVGDFASWLLTQVRHTGYKIDTGCKMRPGTCQLGTCHEPLWWGDAVQRGCPGRNPSSKGRCVT